MDLVADRVVKPSRHVAPDEFDWRHAANFIRIGLPERAVERPTRLPFPAVDCLGKFGPPEIGGCQSTAVRDHGCSRVGVHYAAEVSPGTRNVVSMPPEVAKLCPLASYDEQ